MRKIIKNAEPENFKNWKIKFKQVNKRKPNYNDLGTGNNNILKGELKEALIEEQYGLCCYCCNKITFEKSHIEHFKPKAANLFPELALEHENLHASCNGWKEKRKNCGHKKEKEYNEKIISPLDVKCEDYFEYSEMGKITPKGNDERATYTIDVLNLDDEKLNNARKAALWASGLFDSDELLDLETRQEYINLFSEPVNGLLEPFCNIIIYGFKYF